MEDNKHRVRRILLVTEEELQRIILDIHDGSVQNIFAALSKVQAIQLRCQGGKTGWEPEDLLEIAKVSELVSSALHEIHTTLGTMRHPVFLKKLSEIIIGLVLTHETYTACEVDFTCEG